MEEFELSEQCRLGNNRARKELYEHYGGRLLGVCLRYTGDRDTAQDLLHDGFIKIFSSFDKFTWRGEGSDRKSTRLNSSHSARSRMPSSA